MKISTLLPMLMLAMTLLAGCSGKKEEKAPPATPPTVAPDSSGETTQPQPPEAAEKPASSGMFEVVDEKFALPETDDLKEIKQFANMLTKSEPVLDYESVDTDWEHFFKLQRQYYKALYDTGAKIFDHPEATEKDKKNATKVKAKGLVQIAGYDIETYLEELRQLAVELENDAELANLALTCWAHYYQNHLTMTAFRNDTETLQTAIDETLEFVEKHKNETSINSLVAFLSSFLAYLQNTDVAEANLPKLQEILESSDQLMFQAIGTNIPNQLEQAKKMRQAAQSNQNDRNAVMEEGLARREALPGNEMEMECILLNGEKLSLEDLEGKAVLVDFWATWCGPCLGEIPTMRAAYEKYHDEGFEIIGYSVDNDLDALKEFMEKEQLPWKIGSRSLSLEAGLTNYSQYYGVSTIPTMLLVGKDGKVVSIRARGEALTQELETIFGH